MNKIRCLIVEDEIIGQRIIANYLDSLTDFQLVAKCMNAIQALDILKHEDIDLIFLDIEMPRLNGLSFLKTLKNPPAVIITTAHREYAIEGFDLEVLDYLLKPISFERFLKATNKYLRMNTSNSAYAKEESSDFIYFKSEKKQYRIEQGKISYIEGMNNYILLHTKERRYAVYNSLVEFLKKLGPSFCRIHKSFVINKDYIEYFTKEEVKIGDKLLPIGKTFKEIIDTF